MEPISLDQQLFCQEVLNAQGFLIVADDHVRKLGDIIDDCEMSNPDVSIRLMPPLRVVDWATRADYVQQCNRWGQHMCYAELPHFYKVIVE